MDEQPQRYHEVRALLADLVASWPWDRPGTPFENARIYLDFHCADCGAKLSVNDLAVVLELEMLRLGTVDARKVPYNDPICVRCYIRRAAPVCRFVPDAVDGMARIEEYPTPLGSSPLQGTAQHVVSRQPIQPRRAWWWWHAGASFLVVAMLLIVLALGIALRSFPTQAHTSTLTHPTAPAMTTTAAPTSQPGGQSFRVGTGAYAPSPTRAAP